MPYDLTSEFNIKMHKATYIHYLEVIITPDGVIHYAVPSHQEFLIKYICTNENLSRDELNALCPKEYYFDFLTWLCKKSKCISVWETFYYGELNNAQRESLNDLKLENLYIGKI